MELKNMGCPSCGANLKFNSKTHCYECEYCGASCRDEKFRNAGDPEVEVNPDDLEMLKPQSQSQHKETKKDSDFYIIMATSIIMIVYILLYLLQQKIFG